jgi:hypothetical protein
MKVQGIEYTETFDMAHNGGIRFTVVTPNGYSTSVTVTLSYYNPGTNSMVKLGPQYAHSTSAEGTVIIGLPFSTTNFTVAAKREYIQGNTAATLKVCCLLGNGLCLQILFNIFLLVR